ncbi:nucleotidyltransferase family protein [Chondrinema litorale]|uniref:nucleotidyltransferase family protein n=1 Tax=Chondrinema litorale TaxID=2994555 RepID=UPI002542DC4A|nr:nucleotidyltransferase family protein [Chondrinema litorale]UZR96071.1 nucleotidyltransferase family protein [Chondrinema litorale]
MDIDFSRIGAVILAAGGSSRLGFPKQLLELKQKTLVARSCETILETGIENLIVVTGAYEDDIKKSISSYHVKIAHNPDWETGMASSIKKGINELLKSNFNIEAVLICLCDQPFLDTHHIKEVIKSYYKTGKPIIASYYNDLESVPALFNHSLFESLLELKGQEGARKIIRKQPSLVVNVPFSKGVYDVDTPEAWENIKTLFLNNDD